jgi:hypothetical protein
MRCPFCSYRSPFEVVRCPQCAASIEAADLEELGHIAYLHRWLEEGREAGVLSARLTAKLLADLDRRRLVVETALGLARPTLAPAKPADAVVAPVQPAIGRAAEPLPLPLVEPRPLARPPVPTSPPAPVGASAWADRRRTLSWADVGTYLLSERTLHALLGLGALLILASGVVISTLNPTGLSPAFHLTAVLCTTLLFYGAGYLVRQRLRLLLAGAALLAIGGAFIPLCVWTLGRELLLWDADAIWLIASLLCLPIYLASHALLRDRTFAVLVAVAGGSQLLALVNWIGVSLEWGLTLLVGLAVVYVWLTRRLGPNGELLGWALASVAQALVPPLLVALLGAKFFPAAWEVAARRPLDAWYEYAIGAAWWLGAAFFAYAAQRLDRSSWRVVAIWTVPVAYLLTLTRAPWDAAWHNVALGALAGGYLAFARWRVPRRGGGYGPVVREPVYQAAFGLTLVSAVWPLASADSRIASLTVVALVYAAASLLLRQRAWSFVAVYLLPVVFGLLLQRIGLAKEQQPLAWAAFAAVVLTGAELEVRRAREARRPLGATIVGRGRWQSVFAAPLFSSGYAVGLLALWLAMARYWAAPAVSSVRQLNTPDVLAFVTLVAIGILSSVGRRTSVFLYIATWLFLIPFTATAGRVFAGLGQPLSEAELARVLGVLGVGYLAAAYLTQRLGEHYARPVYLVGYLLSFATMLLSALDRTLNVQVIGLSILVYGVSAWLALSGRHLAYAALVRRLFADPLSSSARHASGLFIYLACWLFPVWLVLALSLRWPPPAVADYGMALTLLAPIYAGIGLFARRVRLEDRWPWYLAGYALSGIGPLVATADPTLRIGALVTSIALFVASTLVSRQSAWLHLVALLTPVLAWMAMDRLTMPGQFVGPVLVLLALAYGGIGVVLHHGWRRLREPIRDRIGAYGQPFFLVGYVLCALGLALVASQDRPLVVLAFALAGVLFAGSALVFRQSVFGYPLVATASVAYVVGMTLVLPDARLRGMGLLPGMLVLLAAAEVLRRRFDSGQGACTVLLMAAERWAFPYYLAAYLGTLAVPLWSTADQGIWAASWWSVSLFYGLFVALFSRPAWLYPSLGAGLVAWLATGYAVVSNLTPTTALATLAIPALVLFAVAFSLARRGQLSEWQLPSLEVLASSRPLAPRWPDPVVVAGWVAMLVAVVGAASEPVAGLRVGMVGVVVMAVLATLWRGRVETWASLLAGGVAFEDALRVVGTPAIDQPPSWALAALVLSVAGLGLRRQASRAFDLWPRPLAGAALAAGSAAMLWALGLQLVSTDRQALQPLSATVALSGLTLVAHGVERPERLLVYAGVALLEIGYMLQLLFFDVGQPQAFVIPAGLYLLAVAYLEWRRGTDRRLKGLIELAGLSLLLGVSVLQALGFLGVGLDRYTYATFLLLESAALFGAGAMLHWRRSFLAGMLALVVDVAILLADPLRALNAWYLAAILGLAMITCVIFIEQRRQQIPFWLHDWQQRLEAWE